MSIEFKYDAAAQVIYETGTGVITIDDFMAYRQEVAELELPDDLRILADYTEATVDFTFEQMRQAGLVSRYIAQWSGVIKLAICTSSDLGFGMARMYAAVANDDFFVIEAFYTLAEGREWLGLTAEE
jgi:hypothetical protein